MKKIISNILFILTVCIFVWIVSKSIGVDSSMEQSVSLAETSVNEERPSLQNATADEIDNHREIDVLADYQHDGHDHANHQHEPAESDVMKVNKQAIDFELKTIEGKQIKLSDYRGKQVLLNFWATWCPPCIEEMPELQKYYEESAGKDNVEILAVNVTDQDLGVNKVEEFVNTHDLTFPILLDETGEVSMNYQILSIPSSFIINEDGVIEEQIIGPLTTEKLRQLFGD